MTCAVRENFYLIPIGKTFTGDNFGPFTSGVPCHAPGRSSDLIDYHIDVLRIVARLAKSPAEAGALGALGCVEALVDLVQDETFVAFTAIVVLPVAITALRNLSTHPSNHGTIARYAATMLWRFATPHNRNAAATAGPETASIAADAAAAVANIVRSHDPTVRTNIYLVQVPHHLLVHKNGLVI